MTTFALRNRPKHPQQDQGAGQSHLKRSLTAASSRFEGFDGPSGFESFCTLGGLGQRSLSLDDRPGDSSQVTEAGDSVAESNPTAVFRKTLPPAASAVDSPPFSIFGHGSLEALHPAVSR